VTEPFQEGATPLSSTSMLWSTVGCVFFPVRILSPVRWLSNYQRRQGRRRALFLLVMVIIIDNWREYRYVGRKYAEKLRLPGCHPGSEAGTVGEKPRSVSY